PRTLEWFERPDDDRIAAALALLERLDAVRNGVLTDTGKKMQRLPLHPRLARMLVAAGGAWNVAQACAILSERHLLPPRTAATTSDLLSAIDQWPSLPGHVKQTAEQVATSPVVSAPVASGFSRTNVSEAEFRRAVLAGYPDRVAQR